MPATNTARPVPPRGRSRPIPPLAAAAVVLLLALLAVTGFKTWRDLRAAERREAELAAAIATTRTEIRALERSIERLRHDPATLERVAREELRMVYPGEVTVVLPRSVPPPPPSPPPAAPAAAAAASRSPAALSRSPGTAAP
ncbi:MAG TPA: septum formation initiator family protein [Thermoanaerobaculia bacterium]|nr:septum formation initiator family protein [Thermoanaerobaculia bacterium]